MCVQASKRSTSSGTFLLKKNCFETILMFFSQIMFFFFEKFTCECYGLFVYWPLQLRGHAARLCRRFIANYAAVLCRFCVALRRLGPVLFLQFKWSQGSRIFTGITARQRKETGFKILILKLHEKISVTPHPLTLLLRALALFRGRGTGRSGFTSVLLKSTSPAVSRLAAST